LVVPPLSGGRHPAVSIEMGAAGREKRKRKKRKKGSFFPFRGGGDTPLSPLRCEWWGGRKRVVPPL
jgi:hypothetical protein